MNPIFDKLHAFFPMSSDIWFLLVGFGLLAWIFWGVIGANFRRQAAFMDQQREFGVTVVEQNQRYEALLAKQYRETNERNERLLSHTAEGLRLQEAALRQLTALNRSLTLLSERLGVGIER